MKKTLAALILVLSAVAARAQNFDGAALAMTDDYLALRAAQAPEPPAAARAVASTNPELGAMAMSWTSDAAEALCGQIHDPGSCTGMGVEDTFDNREPQSAIRLIDHYVKYGATTIVIDEALYYGVIAAHVRELRSHGVKILVASPR